MIQTRLPGVRCANHEPTLLRPRALGTLQRPRKDPARCVVAILDQLRRPVPITFFSALELVNRLDGAEETP